MDPSVYISIFIIIVFIMIAVTVFDEEIETSMMVYNDATGYPHDPSSNTSCAEKYPKYPYEWATPLSDEVGCWDRPDFNS
jgi:hypothetical protein